MYQPALSTANLSVGIMLDRLEAEGTWKLMPSLKSLETSLLSKAIAQRKDYLRLQRDILFKDMIVEKERA